MLGAAITIAARIRISVSLIATKTIAGIVATARIKVTLYAGLHDNMRDAMGVVSRISVLWGIRTLTVS